MKLLFVTDKYYPKPKATVICAQNVIDELIKSGNKVDIIAYKDVGIFNNDYDNVYYIRPDWRMTLSFFAFNFPNSKFAKVANIISIFLNRLTKILLFPYYPLYSIIFPLRLSKKIDELYQKNKYDAIISIYWPFESVLAGYLFKKRNKDAKWFVYSIDPITKYDFKILNKFGCKQKWFLKFANLCDLYIYMRTNAFEYVAFTKTKMVESDIPAMKTFKPDDSSKNDSSKKGVLEPENWVYAGSLSLPHYKTEDLINIFLSLSIKKNRVLHFYSGGDELKKIKKIEKRYFGRIQCHDYVPHTELVKIYLSADVLVSIKYTELISAKIFEYMSYGKPIVHISGCRNDPNVVYIKKYNKGFVICPKWEKDRRNLIDQLEDWLQTVCSIKKVDYTYFAMNQPSYTARIIENNAKKLSLSALSDR